MTHEIVRFTTDPVRRLNAADFILRCYARSKLVVTSRLHVALPCLAMGTPVLFLPRDVADRRFEGLSDFLNMVPLAEAIDDPKLLDPARWPRRTDHLSMRNALIDAVRGFTTRQLV